MNSPLGKREIRLRGLWPRVPGAATCGGAIRRGRVADAQALGAPHTAGPPESAEVDFVRV
jgi:hypothetical protein